MSSLEKIRQQQADYELFHEFWKSKPARLWLALGSDYRFIRETIGSFLKHRYGVRNRNELSPEAIEAGKRLEALMRSRWLKKARRTRQTKKQKEFDFAEVELK